MFKENADNPFSVNVIKGGWSSGVQICPIELNSQITLESLLNNSVNSTPSGQFTQFTIEGKNAYNISSKALMVLLIILP